MVLLLATAAIASEDLNAPAPPPCDVAIVIDRSTVGHAGYTGPTSLSCSSVTEVGAGLCADNMLIATGSTQKVRVAHRRNSTLCNPAPQFLTPTLPPQACVDAAYTDPSCANAIEVSWDAATGACRCDTKASCALSSPGDASWRRLTCAEDGVGPSSAGVAPFVDALVRELSTDAGRRARGLARPLCRAARLACAGLPAAGELRPRVAPPDAAVRRAARLACPAQGARPLGQQDR